MKLKLYRETEEAMGEPWFKDKDSTIAGFKVYPCEEIQDPEQKIESAICEHFGTSKHRYKLLAKSIHKSLTEWDN